MVKVLRYDASKQSKGIKNLNFINGYSFLPLVMTLGFDLFPLIRPCLIMFYPKPSPCSEDQYSIQITFNSWYWCFSVSKNIISLKGALNQVFPEGGMRERSFMVWPTDPTWHFDIPLYVTFPFTSFVNSPPS
jgi:hypothetical protein